MTVIRIADPMGTMPAVQPRQLEGNRAQTAINLKFGNHEARPLDGPTTEATPFYGSDALAIHRYPDVGGKLGTLTQTAAAVSSVIRHSSLSPDGKWLAVALLSTPFVAIYAVDGSAITLPTSPTGGDIPAGQGNQVAWSPDGDHIYLGHNTNPFLSAWPWTGAWGTIITPISTPGVNVTAIAVSPNGGYIAVVATVSPFLKIYSWNGDFVLGVSPTAPDIQAGIGRAVTFSRDTRWVLVSHDTTPFLSTWRWDGTFGGIRTPPDLATGNGRSVVVSPDNLFVSISQTGTPFLRAWRFNSDRESQPFGYLVGNPAVLPGSQPSAISWDTAGGFFFYGLASSPFLEGYAWNQGGWGRKLTPGTNPGGEINALSFFFSDNKLLYGSFSSTTGVLAIDRTSNQWFDWDRPVKCLPGPVANDYRNRRYFTGDGPPKKTGNDIAIPGTGSPPRLPADWFHMGVKTPDLFKLDNEGSQVAIRHSAGSNVHDVAWSPDGKYLAIALSGTPFIEVWDYTDPEFPIKFADPATLPAGAGRSIAWNPDGEFLGIGHDNTPGVSVYPFDEDGFGAKVADPTTTPTGIGLGIAWSPDGDHIGIGHNNNPRMTIYPWDGTFGIKLTDPATLPTGAGQSIAWSPDGKFLGIGHDNTPGVSVYPFDGTIGVKVANPATLPAGDGKGIAWSPDGKHLAIAHLLIPFVSAYPWDGTFGIKLTDPATLPTGAGGEALAWSPDGKHLAIASIAQFVENGSPIAVYAWFPETKDKTIETRKIVTEYVRVEISKDLPPEGDASDELGQPPRYTMEPRQKEVIESEKVTVNSGFSDLVDTPKLLIGQALSSENVSWHPDGTYLAFGTITAPNNIYVYPWLADVIERNYVYTYVTGWGEESGPGDPVRMEEEAHFNVPFLQFPSEDLTRYNITHRRIYRIVAGETGADFLFVAEIPIGDTTFTDVKKADDLGGILVTVGWNEPPRNLVGLTSVQGGFLAGISGKLICFSEPFAPYAWPMRYRRSLSDTPLAIGSVGGSVIVATEGRPVVYDGLHPGSMASIPLDAEQGCSNAESLVEVPGGVIYASPDGLFYVTPGTWTNITRQLLSKQDWQALRPGTMVGVIYDGRYHGFYDSDGAGTFKALVVDITSLDIGLRTDQSTSGSLSEVPFYDVVTDILYLVIGGVIKKWDDDAAAPLTATWKSKKYPLLRPENLARLRVRASYPGTVTVKVFGDGVLRHTANITSATPVPLPGGYRADEFEFELSSTIAWHEMVAATSVQEMRQVP